MLPSVSPRSYPLCLLKLSAQIDGKIPILKKYRLLNIVSFTMLLFFQCCCLNFRCLNVAVEWDITVPTRILTFNQNTEVSELAKMHFFKSLLHAA